MGPDCPRPILPRAEDRDDADVAGGCGIPGVRVDPVQDAMGGHDELPVVPMIGARRAEIGVGAEGAEVAQRAAQRIPLPQPCLARPGLVEPFARRAKTLGRGRGRHDPARHCSAARAQGGGRQGRRRVAIQRVQRGLQFLLPDAVPGIDLGVSARDRLGLARDALRSFRRSLGRL